MVEITTVDIIIRLSLATVVSALIGIEREWHKKPAGIRTNVMVGLGACLITMASVQVPGIWGVETNSPVDPGRIAAQIVSGIGFIGAGAILRSKRGAVVGLTTAATLWVVAGLGIAIGFGFFIEAIATTAMVLFTFIVLGRVVNQIRKARGEKGNAMLDEDIEDQVGEENDGVSAGDFE